jgi:pantoate--beta-alanine ligase
LDDAQRKQATCLFRALGEAQARIETGEADPAAVVGAMRQIVDDAGPTDIDYISVVDPESMQPVQRIERPVLVLLAVRIGSTRLIDNLQVDPCPPGG